MMTKNVGIKDKMIVSTMEEMVPQDHILRKIDKSIKFSFIYDIVQPYYCSVNGRAGIDPVILFKILFIQILFGIKSLRQTCRDIEVNAAYRWFLGIPFGEDIPHYSTISQNYKRRYKDTDVYEQIFKHILNHAIVKNYIDGEEIFTDSTHVKANANKKKYEEVVKDVVNKKKQELEDEINQEREKLGLNKKIILKDTRITKSIKVSKTDPESGYYCRDEKEKGFMYCDHRTVDGKHNMILDTYVTPGNVHDSVPLIGRLLHIKENIIPFNQVALDSGYLSFDILRFLEEYTKFSVIAYRRFGSNKETYSRKQFIWVAEHNLYICPLENKLLPKTVNRQGYVEYHSDKDKCKNCPIKHLCIGTKSEKKVIRRHIYEVYKERNRERRLSPQGKGLYSRRCCTIERSFADSKQNHGYRYAIFRGLKKNQDWAWLLCATQNMKKIALLDSRLAS